MTLKLKMKPRTYDFYMMLLTTAVLAIIGLVCLYGIGYYTYTTETIPGWTETPLYGDYIDNMNQYIYPFVVLLLVVLGLCIPKRIVPRQSLLASGTGILAVTLLIALVTDIGSSLAFLLAVSIVVQTAVMVLTMLGRSGLTYEREGYFVQTGSSMLHLGTVVFVLDFVSFRTSDLHLSIFWVATILITVGTLLSFYPGEVGRVVRLLRPGNGSS
ncbi:MAG: hypothetical protein SCH39_09825 [Methanosarcinales archaeon]|nr:hypothetical protein [Methanosarcinales archaeon]